MKLIVDVPDNVYVKVMEYYEHNEIVEAVYSYIYCGIPLEQIRKEIADLKWDDYLSIGGFKKDVLQIIAKYTK